jgi:hypothetical protein
MERPKAARSLLPAATIVAVILASIAIFAAANSQSPSSGPPSSSARPLPSASPLPPSVAPSIEATPAATPAPTVDPARAALDAMSAAIAAARGGPDGLKGKDANDLEARAGAVGEALDGGDRAAALDAARKLERRIADMDKGLGKDQAARLRAASADLVRALGG